MSAAVPYRLVHQITYRVRQLRGSECLALPVALRRARRLFCSDSRRSRLAARRLACFKRFVLLRQSHSCHLRVGRQFRSVRRNLLLKPRLWGQLALRDACHGCAPNLGTRFHGDACIRGGPHDALWRGDTLHALASAVSVYLLLRLLLLAQKALGLLHEAALRLPPEGRDVFLALTIDAALKEAHMIIRIVLFSLGI